MTVAETITNLRNRGFPDDLSDTMITQAVTDVLSDLTADYPMQVFGTFTAVSDQQVYDLFSATIDLSTQQGALTGGIRVLELIGGPISGDSDADVFGITPWLQNTNIFSGLDDGWSMNYPGDFTLWESNWQSWSRRFGVFSFEHTESRSGSPIRIIPKPTDTRTILVKYTRPRTEAEILAEDESWFLLFVMATCCDTLANIFSAAAGIKVGEMADQGKTVTYWQDMADRNEKRARELFEKRKFETLGLGMRS